ncbi:hypothetical protein KCP69_15530 [Salmonella enterica subsp. enterica]|nr:hypothetical protein KCP69_15530 [Salmonella enterica subsp. enterica]
MGTYGAGYIANYRRCFCGKMGDRIGRKIVYCHHHDGDLHHADWYCRRMRKSAFCASIAGDIALYRGRRGEFPARVPLWPSNMKGSVASFRWSRWAP